MHFTKWLIAFVLIGTSLNVCAQRKNSGSLKGHLVDSATGQGLESATISIFDSKDSSLLLYTLSKPKGDFEITGLPLGKKLQLLVTYNGYREVRHSFTLTAQQHVQDMGVLGLVLSAKQLDEITLTAQKPPIVVKGDTIEFDADSFKTLPNAVVEDLLKKMPGVEVEKDGSMTFNGKKVTKVMVDGRDFFSNNLKIATQNLPANIIDKVQVTESKTEEQKKSKLVTPPSDEVTLNLTLKKDKKQGYFGKISAGYGTDGRYNMGAMINSFRNASRLSFIGSAGNTNQSSFGLNDVMDMMSQGNGGVSSISITSGAGFSVNGVSFGNQGNGNAVTRSAGLNFNNEYGKNLKVNGSYFYSWNNTEVDTKIQRTNILPDSTFLYNSTGTSKNRGENHNASVNINYKIDSTSSFTLSPSINYGNSAVYSLLDAASSTTKGVSINKTMSQTVNYGKRTSFSNQFSFNKAFRDNKTSFTLNWNISINDNNARQFNRSENDYFDNGVLDQSDSVDQYGTTKTKGSSNSLSVSLSRELSKHWSTSLSYNLDQSSTETDRRYSGYNATSGKYDVPDSTLSNHYKNTSLRQSPYWQLAYSAKKLTLSLNSGVTFVKQDNRFLLSDSVIHIQQANFSPSMNVFYQFSKAARFNLSYRVSSNSPTAEQLSPVVDNSNPLYIKKGNPDLKAAFVHNGNASLYYTIVPKNIFLSANFFASYNKNQIISQSMYDTVGRQISSYRNVSGAYSVSGNMSFSKSKKWKTGSWRLNARLNLGDSKSIGFVDTSLNESNTWTFGPRVSFTYSFNDKVELVPSAGINYTMTNYSLASLSDVRYNVQTLGMAVNLTWPARMVWENSGDYRFNSQIPKGFQRTNFLWNSMLSYRFMKSEQLTVRLSVYDLLNKNINVFRTVAPTYIMDQQTNIMRRYFMLTLLYNLNKFNAGGSKLKTGRMRMDMF